MKILLVLAFLGQILYSHQQEEVCVSDMAILIDSSGSIRDYNVDGNDNWRTMINFVDQIVDNLDIGLLRTRVAAISFSNKAIKHFDLSLHDEKDLMIKDIEGIFNLYQGGTTNTTGAFKVAQEQVFRSEYGDRNGISNVIILITDGNPTVDVDNLMPTVNAIKQSGVTIIGVGVTHSVNTTLLKQIVSQPADEHYMTVDRFEQLSQLVNKIALSSCQTILTPDPTLIPPSDCRQSADVGIIIDGSSSIGDDPFRELKDSISQLILDLDIDSGNVRLAVGTFSSSYRSTFKLNTHDKRKPMIDAVNKMEYMRAGDDTAKAINYAKDEMFTAENGARDNMQKILILITDSRSRNQEDTINGALEAKKNGIHIIVISLGTWLDMDELRTIASFPHSTNLIQLQNARDLRNKLDKIRDMICNNINECESNPCIRGQCVDMIQSYMCICPTGYAGFQCDDVCPAKIDVVFTLDASDTIQHSNFRKQLDFVIDVGFGLNFNGQSKIGLQLFADGATTAFNLNEYTDQASVMNAINMFYTKGKSKMEDSVKNLVQNMMTSSNGVRNDPDVMKVAVIITDGKAESGKDLYDFSMAMHAQKIKVLVIAVGNAIKQSQLECIATDPVDANIMKISNFDSLGSIEDDVIASLCNKINDCSPNPCLNNGVCIDGMNGYTCQCSSEYTGTECQYRDSGEKDLIFAFDVSGSIRHEEFQNVLEYFTKFIDNYEVRPDKTRIGLIAFSDKPTIYAYLNQYESKKEIRETIRMIAYVSKRTNIAETLTMIDNQMFTSERGDRSNAENILILFTDGQANINAKDTIKAGQTLRDKGTHIIVVAISDLINWLDIYSIVSHVADNNIFRINRYSQLREANNVLNGFKLTLNDENECSSNPCGNGGTCVDSYGYYFCECSENWSGINCETSCSATLDIAFVLDLSGSSDGDTYEHLILAFIKRVVTGLPMNFDRVRFAAVSYSDSTNINFYLKDYSHTLEILNALSFERTVGKTNTQDAIRKTYQDVFNSNNGDRSNAPNVMIVLTDGGSNINAGNTLDEASRAKENGIFLYSIALGRRVNLNEINGISSGEDKYTFSMPDKDSVKSVAENVVRSLCETRFTVKK